jgi:hypothetical protein
MLGKLLVYVEELSMEAALEHLLPGLLGEVPFEIYRFQCKQELLKQVPCRLRAFSKWLPEDWVILVVVDRDDDDCLILKEQLESHARAAGLNSKAQAGSGRFQVVNRVVEEELEAWFFGDWEAVQTAYPRVLPTIPERTKFRLPDRIVGGTWEAFERVLQVRELADRTRVAGWPLSRARPFN